MQQKETNCFYPRAKMGAWASVILTCALMLCASVHAAEIDWDKVPVKAITLFYPGPTSWEMLLTQADHSGADKFRAGKDCASCHGGEEKASGSAMIAQDKPVAGFLSKKPPSVPINVQIAVSEGVIFLRAALRVGDQPDAALDKDFATKLSVMIGDRAAPDIARGGCFAACHDDSTSMPDSALPAVSKYLVASRQNQGRHGGGSMLDATTLSALAAAGRGLDYWQARLGPSDGLSVAEGSVLDRRSERPDVTISAKRNTGAGLETVIFQRTLSGSGGRITFQTGHSYMIGLALHAGHTAKRFHYVSLPLALTVGSTGPADFSVTP
jgi:cytochrome c-type protein NapC